MYFAKRITYTSTNFKVLPTSAGALRFRTRFIHGQSAAVELIFMKLFYGFVGILLGHHLDKCKPPRATGFRLAHHVNRFDNTGLTEKRFESGFVDFVR